MACNKCQKKTNSSDSIICRGYCGKSYHMICVKMDFSVRDLLKEHDKNLFWMCDGCADLFSRDHFRKIATGCSSENAHDADSLKSLKDGLAELKEIVGALSSKVDAKPFVPVATSSWTNSNRTMSLNNISNTPKRKRVETLSVEKPTNIRGTKAASALVKTIAPPEELFWVYLSAFDPSTSDSDISTFVKSCMELTDDVDPKVVRLVAKDRDPSTLSFVTYKVGVKKSLKDVALSKDTWPENIFFREFDNNSKNSRNVVKVSAD